ncbi:MAG: hypothetical protein DRR16_01495 [Candidatus Parabeggiatoa sp. nov. 3]|nr:MAG: hypothetical protein DRR00_11010 [Gammaproteobacteria bacterium]RKZ59382.1 MAG: hypothetical protein DRQ99_23805 [Gammaproteobacteria bacterium]RKZ89862.1 MAG: hypothetical protein DRR16_01495 [Gammaproteobacteria bacterium]
MSSAKTKNTSLALAISTVLATTSYQAALATPNDTSHSTVNSFILLAEAKPALPLATAQQPSASLEQLQYEAFENSKYTDKDAKLLTMYWDYGDFSNAKLYIGSLLMSGDDATVQKVLQQAQLLKQQDEAFWNSKYTIDDAELLAESWGKPTLWDAKLKIGSLLMSGDDAAIQKALQQAANQANPEQQDEQQQSEAFWNSKYTYNDAQLLAEWWGMSAPWDAKLKIGRLLMNGNDAAIQKELQQQQQSNAFWNGKYTIADAQILAEYWNKSELWDAKLKIGSLLMSGDNAAVKKALQQAKQTVKWPN